MLLQADEDDRTQLPEYSRPFPQMITIAGFLWLIVGGFMAISAAVLLLQLNEGRQAIMAMGVFGLAMLIALAFYGLLGFAFIFIGVRTMLGAVKDTMHSAASSLLIGMGLGVEAIRGVDSESVVWMVFLCVSVLLLAAGVLALIGRKDYLSWRQD